MKKEQNQITCPCQSKRTYQECCGPYIQDQSLPPTPEALMRSRYTAYSQGNIAYIQKTMRGTAAMHFNPQEAQQWASQVRWLGLKIISAPIVANHEHIGFVEFIASFHQGGRRHIIHERSEFHKQEGCWYYVAGITPKIGRNEPCPCDSGKKFKQCCQMR